MNPVVIVVMMMMICSSSAVAFMMSSRDDGTKKNSPETKKNEDETEDEDVTGGGGGTVTSPVGLYTTSQGIRHQGNNPSKGKTEDLWYYTNHGKPWAKYYKFACEDSSGKESEKVGPYGPISSGNHGSPTIRFAPKDTKPCDPNTLVVYRSDSADGDYKAIHRGVKNSLTSG